MKRSRSREAKKSQACCWNAAASMRPYTLGAPKRERAGKKRSTARSEDGKRPLILYQDPELKVHALKEGGPVQRLITEDLQKIREEFVKEYLRLDPSCTNSEEEFSSSHQPIQMGQSFRIFKGVAQESKIHLLSTDKRLAFHRCDINDHIQVIYAACFYQLRKLPMEDSNLMIYDAAFWIFTIYFVYETQSLPTPPEDEQGVLTMLPMGLTEHPYREHRRHFQRPIRIDRQHYSLIWKVRDLCQEIIDLCRKKNQKCNCILPTDLIEVIDRLWSRFEAAEYTGPMSTEGLAGHHDYPFPENYKAFLAKQKCSSSSTTATPAVDDKSVDADAVFCFSESLNASLTKYSEAKKAIRLPPKTKSLSHRLLRIRESAEKIFSTNPVASISDAMSSGEPPRRSLRIVSRRVTFADYDHSDSSPSHPVTEKDTEAPKESTKLEVVHDIVLPQTIPTSLRMSLVDAFHEILNRNPRAFIVPRADEQSEAASRASYASMTTQGTSESRIGHSAIKALLSAQRQDFLRLDTVTDSPSVNEDSELSDLSDVDEHEVPMVGRAALEALLTTQYDDEATLSSVRSSVKRTRKPNTTTRKSIPSSGNKDENPWDDSSDSDESLASVESSESEVMRGKEALSILFKKPNE